jgi:hypothetical protein
MKVIRTAVCAAALVIVATGVATSQTQANQIVGAWTCAAITAGSVVAGNMTYNANGTMDSNVSVNIEFEEGELVIMVVTKSSWKLTSDGLIEEQILSAAATSGTFAGKALGADDLAQFGDSVPKDISRSTVEVSADEMTLVDGEGTQTICAR